MLIRTELWSTGRSGGFLMSLPGDADLVGRLSVPEVARCSSGGGSTPVEEQVLALFDELRAPLLRYLISLRVAPPRSEEILQDTFVKLFEHLKANRPGTNLRGWLFRVAHNLALQELRRHDSSTVASGLELQARLVEDPCPDPEQQLILDQHEARMLAALQRLPDTEQRCMHLRAEGLRYREISDVLHIGVSTVADSLRRAIDAIRKELHG